MTLKELYYANSAWHVDTIIAVKIKTAGQIWTAMRDTISNLPEKVLVGEVICFNNNAVIMDSNTIE